MKMKRIQAANMKDAMALARKELGDHAVLIDSQDNGKNSVIVTFAIDQSADDDFFEQALAEPEQIVPFTPAIPKPTVAKVELDHPAHEIIYEALLYHAVPDKLRDLIMTQVNRTPLQPDHVVTVAEQALAKALTAILKFQPLEPQAAGLPTRALMLVGPHGAGKTSTIAKLATQLALRKQPLHLISTDTERLGGAESLHLLAKLLKCTCTVSESRADLKAQIAQTQGKAWTLVDTSGANIYEFAQLKALGEFASLNGVEPILTCPAGMDPAESMEMASVFNFIPIERMILTRLDAVRRLGCLFAALSTGGYALANYSNSALPTDNCHPLNAATLARLMVRQVRERMTH